MDVSGGLKYVTGHPQASASTLYTSMPTTIASARRASNSAMIDSRRSDEARQTSEGVLPTNQALCSYTAGTKGTRSQGWRLRARRKRLGMGLSMRVARQRREEPT